MACGGPFARCSEALASDPRYATNAARSANRDTLIAVLQEVFLRKTYEEWEAILLPAGIPIGRLNTIDRVVEHPQLLARGALAESEHPIAGAVKMVSPRFHLSETPGGVRASAPLLGQHTDEILRERLGLGEAEIERLRGAGAVGPRRGP